MSTNYYLSNPNGSKLHLGKSSVGWTFALHVYPGRNINDLSQLIAHIELEKKDNESIIIDEYGTELTYHGFLEVVAKRYNPRIIKAGWDSDWWSDFYDSEEHFHQCNHSIRGPSGLFRRRVDNERCIGHGYGTWDYCVGEFS
jgi:hypothetical protein